MSRPAGLPKTGGRRKGTSNKKTQALEETLLKLGVDVPSQIAEILPQIAPEKRVDVLMDLMAFLYPKRKAIENQIELEMKSPEELSRSVEDLRMSIAGNNRINATLTNDPELSRAFNKIAESYENYNPAVWDE